MIQHLSSEQLWKELGQWVWHKEPISEAAAVTIASQWMDPNTTALVELATCNRVSDKLALRHEILDTGRHYDYPVELAALLEWTDNA